MKQLSRQLLWYYFPHNLVGCFYCQEGKCRKSFGFRWMSCCTIWLQKLFGHGTKFTTEFSPIFKFKLIVVFIFTKNASLTLKVSFHRLAHCCAIFLWATNYSWVTFQLICHWRILSGVNLKCAGWSPDVKSRKGQSSRNQQSFPADLANCLFLLPGNIRRTTWNFVFVIYIYICCDKQFFF